MSTMTHYTTNGWDAACSARFYDNMTHDTSRVTCSHCCKVIERLRCAKTKPARGPQLAKEMLG